jgi:membrane protein YqaA with SNARE-associated domain
MIQTKRLTRAALLVTGLPVLAKAQSATPASGAASQVQPNAVPGSDPSWMVADVGIALVIGLVVGYLIGAWRSSAKQRTSHA